MFQSNKTFCEGQIHWMFPLSHSMALVFDACVRRVSLLNCDIANTTCIQEHLLYEPDFRGCALYIFRSTQCIYIIYIYIFFMCKATIICLTLHTNKALWVCSEAEHEMLILSCCQCEAVRVYFELWHLTSVHNNNTDQEQLKNNSTTSVGLVVTVEIAWVEWVTLTVAFSWIHLAL